MDKQKQIEEMARELGEQRGYGCIKDSVFCIDCILHGDCMPSKYATTLYNAGYRKIPENAVVLTRSEYDEFLKTNNYLSDQLTLCHLQLKDMGLVRKETAEKFSERLKALYSEYDEYDELYIKTIRFDIDEICKEFTEGKNV